MTYSFKLGLIGLASYPSLVLMGKYMYATVLAFSASLYSHYVIVPVNKPGYNFGQLQDTSHTTVYAKRSHIELVAL